MFVICVETIMYLLLHNLYDCAFKLVEGDKILNDDENIAEKLNNFFQNAFPNSNIQENSFIHSKDYHNLSDPVQRAIAKYYYYQFFIKIYYQLLSTLTKLQS